MHLLHVCFDCTAKERRRLFSCRKAPQWDGMHTDPGALAALQGLMLEPGGTQAWSHLTEKPWRNTESTEQWHEDA